MSVSEEAITDFKQLLRLAKIGPATLENSTKASPAYGLSREWTENAREYWLNNYDWYVSTQVQIYRHCCMLF